MSRDPLANVKRSGGTSCCQPCGECEWCFARHDYRRLALRYRRLLREAASAISDELEAARPYEDHPVLMRHDRLLDRITTALHGKAGPARPRRRQARHASAGHGGAGQG